MPEEELDLSREFETEDAAIDRITDDLRRHEIPIPEVDTVTAQLKSSGMTRIDRPRYTITRDPVKYFDIDWKEAA